MTDIDETSAWRILHAFTRDCLVRSPGSLRAVYAVGPLPGGYYQAGSADLPVVLIAADEARSIWGCCFTPGPALEVLNEHYHRAYHLGEESEASVLLDCELRPPYRNAQAVPVIARLKIEGRLLWGSAGLDAVPMPTPKDARHAARQYERWWESVYPDDEAVFAMPLPDCAAAVREQIFRYLWIERGQIEFQPLRQLEAFRAANPPCLDPTAARLLERRLTGDELSSFEADLLRAWLIELRQKMNQILHI